MDSWAGGMLRSYAVPFISRFPVEAFDYIIIGGGIVGLATGWTLLNRNRRLRVAVLEKEADWARHQTGRNSGVIHSGIYYKPGSLKAKLCREGNRRMVEFCKHYGISYETCGKVILASSAAELPALHKLFERGRANDLAVRLLSSTEVREIEPHVVCLAGVHVPSTGIVDYRRVSLTLAELIAKNGGDLRLNTRVTSLRSIAGSVIVETSDRTMAAHKIVNCAGLYSDRVARLAGERPDAQIVPFRGEYYELKPERRKLVGNLVYPVPDPTFPFLGVHFTRMIGGAVHAGPNAVLSLRREGYHRASFDARDFFDTMSYAGFWRLAARHAQSGLDEIYRSFSKKAFVNSLRRLIPEINDDDLVPAEAGVRAQAVRADGTLVDDFLIIESSNAVHVCNAPSPAATASLEIARVIVDRLQVSPA